MKNVVEYRTYSRFNLLIVLAFILTLTSCSKDDTEIEGEAVDEPTAIPLVTTPIVGGTYIIQNDKSGRTLDVNNASNSNSANVQLWGTSTGTAPTHRQWEVLSVGNGYVRLRGVDSGKSLQTGRKTANGSNVNQYEYVDKDWQEWKLNSLGNNLYSIENRYSGKVLRAGGTTNGSNVDIWSWKNWRTQKWYFHSVGGSNNSGDSAADIIGSGWKLNGYTGNLNVSSNDNGLNYADNASTSESHFFFEKDGFAAFRCYPGNPTSSNNTSNPRSELRELIGGGSNYWDGTTSTERSMKMRFKVEDLPPSGKLAFMQIHERVDPFDDVVRVQVQGSSGQNSGAVTLRINGYVTENIEGQGRSIDFNMQLDTEYYFELTMRRGVVTLYNLNNSGNRTQTLFQSVDIGDADENYFKAGCYLQSTSSGDSGSNVYGQVLIKNLVVNPND